jgi:SNF2 family DNA or RNA helicase
VEKGALETNPLDDDDESESDSDTETESEIDSEIEDETLGGFIVGDCETEDDNQGAGGEGESRSNQKQKQKKVTMKKFVQRNKGKKPAKATAKEPKGSDKRKSLAQLKKEGQRNKASRRRYFKRLEKFYEPSAKISRTIEILNEIQSTSGHKTLIFSQFTSFLDILEVGLRRENYTLVRYDGSMSTDQRAAAVEKFRKDATIPVMLLSLKAGNAGLNLNFASEVLILDPFWNPFVEEQAMDRAHRIGQRHNVHVRRVVVPGTVEDRILTLQEEKRSMINTALDENAGKNIGRLGTRELAFLFGLDERGRELPAVQRDMITASPSRV